MTISLDVHSLWYHMYSKLVKHYWYSLYPTLSIILRNIYTRLIFNFLFFWLQKPCETFPWLLYIYICLLIAPWRYFLLETHMFRCINRTKSQNFNVAPLALQLGCVHVLHDKVGKSHAGDTFACNVQVPPNGFIFFTLKWKCRHHGVVILFYMAPG